MRVVGAKAATTVVMAREAVAVGGEEQSGRSPDGGIEENGRTR